MTKNEERAIARCVAAASFCDQILVVDSHSTDCTVEIAEAAGATVLAFTWNGYYPKKKQWGMQHEAVRNDWVLHLDADEVVSGALAKEITAAVTNTDAGVVAYEARLAYFFAGRLLKHGHQVRKRILLDRRYVRFPEIDDLDAPGITEVEGHYQPVASGPVQTLTEQLLHDDPDPLSTWIERHNKYAGWEAHLRTHDEVRTRVRRARSLQGRIFDRLPGKPLGLFLYSFLVRLGFLDGRAGFDYAYAMAWYQWLINANVRESLEGRRGH
nr:glycosyltransferase family 2 protein [Nocardioides ginsengisegetis]